MIQKPKFQRPVFYLEKFIPTRCPVCAQAFDVNSDRGFLYDTTHFHQHELTPERVIAVTTGIQAPGLGTDLIVCGSCRNTTLRVHLEAAEVQDEVSAERLKAEGFNYCTTAEYSGRVPFRPFRVVHGFRVDIDT